MTSQYHNYLGKQITETKEKTDFTPDNIENNNSVYVFYEIVSGRNIAMNIDEIQRFFAVHNVMGVIGFPIRLLGAYKIQLMHNIRCFRRFQ